MGWTAWSTGMTQVSVDTATGIEEVKPTMNLTRSLDQNSGEYPGTKGGSRGTGSPQGWTPDELDTNLLGGMNCAYRCYSRPGRDVPTGWSRTYSFGSVPADLQGNWMSGGYDQEVIQCSDANAIELTAQDQTYEFQFYATDQHLDAYQGTPGSDYFHALGAWGTGLYQPDWDE